MQLEAVKKDFSKRFKEDFKKIVNGKRCKLSLMIDKFMKFVKDNNLNLDDVKISYLPVNQFFDIPNLIMLSIIVFDESYVDDLSAKGVCFSLQFAYNDDDIELDFPYETKATDNMLNKLKNLDKDKNLELIKFGPRFTAMINDDGEERYFYLNHRRVYK